ncbi:hypothetical protein IWQ51_006007 [Labrenzia sp. EL_142]|nr:hypothetical protein [Labrenzia sp. EL_142]
MSEIVLTFAATVNFKYSAANVYIFLFHWR